MAETMATARASVGGGGKANLRKELEALGVRALKAKARELDVPGRSKLDRAGLIEALVDWESAAEEEKLPVVRFDLKQNSGLFPALDASRLAKSPTTYKAEDAPWLAEQFVAYVQDCQARTKLEMHKGSLVEVPKPDPVEIQGFCSWVGISTRTFERWGQEPDEGEEPHALYHLASGIRQVIISDAMRLAHDSRTSRGAMLHLCSLGFKMRQDVTSDDKPVNVVGQLLGEIDGDGFDLPGAGV